MDGKIERWRDRKTNSEKEGKGKGGFVKLSEDRRLQG